MLAPALLVLCSACGGQAPEPRSAAPATPGATRLALEDHLSWPYSLERIVVVVDGAPVAIQSAPTRNDLGALGMAAGPHTIQYMAQVSYASGSTDTGCKAELRGAHSFDSAPASIVLDVFARDVTHPFAERLGVDVRASGVASAGSGESGFTPSQTQSEDPCN